MLLDPMDDPNFDEALITALRELSARPVTNRKELAAWRVEADRLEQSLTPEQADGVPQFVWHYLADADIRLRNPGYRADQERQLEQALRELGPRAHKSISRRRP
jgi:hypothetical protein